MQRMRQAVIGALLALIAAAALAPPAGAVEVPRSLIAPTEQQMLDRALPIARAAWPGSPCEGRENVLLNQDAILTAEHPAGDFTIAEDAGPDCRIRMLGKQGHTQFCSALMHGLGHEVLGPAFAAVNPADPVHSPDRSNIMWYGGSVSPACFPTCPWGQAGAACDRALKVIALRWDGYAMPAYMRTVTVAAYRSGWMVRYVMRSGRVARLFASRDWTGAVNR